MTCSEAERLIDAILDGDLEGSPRLDGHLGICAACRRRWEALRRTVEDLRTLPLPPLPDALGDRIMRRLPTTELEDRSRRAAACVAAGCMFLASLFVLGSMWQGGLGEKVISAYRVASEAVLSLALSATQMLDISSPGYLAMAIVAGGVLAAGLLALTSIAKLCSGFLAVQRRSG